MIRTALMLGLLTLSAACLPARGVGPTPDVPKSLESGRIAGEPKPMGAGEGWKVVFADEFDGRSLDTRKWATCYWWNDEGCTNLGNSELQWYIADGVTVSDGILR